MSTEFITNQEKTLSEIIKNILPSTEKLYVLVGYFYFSGFEAIYKTIGDKEVKILIGLDVEKDLLNKIKEVEFIQELNLSRGKIKDNFNKSFVGIFNDTDYFDTIMKQEAFTLFLQKIHDGTLEIRKTLKPNHAKLYLFQKKQEFSEGGRYPGAVITGSSNLSLSGLKQQFEINVLNIEHNENDSPNMLDCFVNQNRPFFTEANKYLN